VRDVRVDDLDGDDERVVRERVEFVCGAGKGSELIGHPSICAALGHVRRRLSQYDALVFLDHPRGFRDPACVTERPAMLETVQSVQPLRAWAADLAARRDVHIPQFDLAEAGVDAKVPFLLEAPGPMTNAGNPRAGSGFISVDNNGARSTRRRFAGYRSQVGAWAPGSDRGDVCAGRFLPASPDVDELGRV
jgi:hypothetical protein